MNRLALFVAPVALVSGCAAERASAEIGRQYERQWAVDLRAAVPGDWNRVCFLGPYPIAEDATHLLGRPWDLQDHSAVWQSDG
ncbi:hypothetical protein ACFFGH_09105 [Lysobacter korlensis]|uniref:Lipoprotein n=1 Tax=Lysobacter korlensis TaxID=553636 RepID=A0ABV6RQ11_9GAMM